MKHKEKITVKATETFIESMNKPKVKTWNSLLQTYRALYSHLEGQLLQQGASLSRFQILHTLYFEGPHAPVALARRMHVSRANITNFLRRLLDDGLIEPCVESGSVKRPYYKLSETGRNYFEQIFPSHIEDIEKVMEVLPDNVLETLETMKSKLHPKASASARYRH